MAQDNNAQQLSGQAAITRALTKSSSNYRNSSWDLVDAVQTEHLDLGTVKADELPANMQSMNAEQRAGYVTAKAKERTELQSRIRQLNQQRDTYVAQQTAKQPQTQTLGSAVRQVVREQATRKNYTFQSTQNPAPAGNDSVKNP